MLSQFRRVRGTRQQRSLVLGAMILVVLPAPCIGQASQGIAPIARQRIHIALSVRPSFDVRQQQPIEQSQRPFCISSNSSMHRYEVQLEMNRKLANSTLYRGIGGQELECSKFGPTKPQSRGELESSSGEWGVVTLIISPY